MDFRFFFPFQWTSLWHGEGYNVNGMIEIQISILETSFDSKNEHKPSEFYFQSPIQTANTE